MLRMGVRPPTLPVLDPRAPPRNRYVPIYSSRPTSSGGSMRGVEAMGIMVGAVGFLLLIVSVAGSQAVLTEYESRVPWDTTGPCEGMGQDLSACNALHTYQSLWVPGWALLILGIVIFIAARLLPGHANAPPQPSLSQGPPSQVQLQPPGFAGPPMGKYCSACGVMNAASALFCGACGSRQP